jgi:ribosomal protein RSM22 (predicted rRNA methylase)
MIGADFVQPLDESWREIVDAVGRARGWPTTREPARLGAQVAALSVAYNDPRQARASVRDAGAARLGFSFARDVPKGAAAVRELLALGVLRRDAPLRVLDLGAGLGAMTWGVQRARVAAGGDPAVEATWVDSDAEALELGHEIARMRAISSRHDVQVRGVKAPAVAATAPGGALGGRGSYDLVILGQVLSELDTGLEPVERAAAHAFWLGLLLERFVAPDGSLVVVEPGLRDRSRHLHRVRDGVLAAGSASVFAPCTHAAGCPALATEGDWCHEDLRVDLPSWLAPVARAAGLRYEGLTFSYLVLRRDGATLARSLAPPASAGLFRVVSDRMKTKGKVERFLCGELLGEKGAHVVGRARTMRLDRHATDENQVWEDLARGDVATIAPIPHAARARVEAETRVSAAGKKGGR